MKMILETKATLYDDASTHEKLKVMDAWAAMMDDERNRDAIDWETEVSKVVELGKRYKITLLIEEIPTLTCPWCGYDEIERPMIESEGEHSPIEGLAECEVCGAEEIDPAELDTEPRHKAGWRQSNKVKLYNPERHGPLQGSHFAISCGTDWQAYTKAGRLVRLPEDHPMVVLTKGYNAVMKQINARTGEPTGG